MGQESRLLKTHKHKTILSGDCLGDGGVSRLGAYGLNVNVLCSYYLKEHKHL